MPTVLLPDLTKEDQLLALECQSIIDGLETVLPDAFSQYVIDAAISCWKFWSANKRRLVISLHESIFTTAARLKRRDALDPLIRLFIGFGGPYDVPPKYHIFPEQVRFTGMPFALTLHERFCFLPDEHEPGRRMLMENNFLIWKLNIPWIQETYDFRKIAVRQWLDIRGYETTFPLTRIKGSYALEIYSLYEQLREEQICLDSL